MLRKPLSILCLVTLNILAIAPAVSAVGSATSSPAVQEDLLLKSVEPDATPAPKRERATTSDRESVPEEVSDTSVQQDLLLQSTKPGERPPPKKSEKLPVKTENKAKSFENKPVPKKDSKIQEDLILKSVEPK